MKDKTIMKQKLHYLFPLFILAGCGDDSPSAKYPEQVIFQNLDITISQGNVEVASDYFSNGVLYFSSADEKQYLSINNNQTFELDVKRSKKSTPDFISSTTISAEQLSQPIKQGDELKVSFNRSTGNVLESRVIVPDFIQFISPNVEQKIDHSTTDIDIQWDMPAQANSKLYLQGHCLEIDYVKDNQSYLNNLENEVYRSSLIYELSEGQTNLTLLANSLSYNEWFEDEQCEVTANLYYKASGEVDSHFAGGHINLINHSQLTFTLTNIAVGNNND